MQYIYIVFCISIWTNVYEYFLTSLNVGWHGNLYVYLYACPFFKVQKGCQNMKTRIPGIIVAEVFLRKYVLLCHTHLNDSEL